MWKTLLYFGLTAHCVVSGYLLKCGEDIVIARGEKKTLRFWSDDEDKLNAQVVPSDPNFFPSHRRPVSYNQIPGLSQAISDHNQYRNNYISHDEAEKQTDGLHYAGNPDVEYLEDAYRSNNASSNDEAQENQDDYIYDTVSDYAIDTTLSPSTTTTTAPLSTTTSLPSTTTATSPPSTTTATSPPSTTTATSPPLTTTTTLPLSTSTTTSPSSTTSTTTSPPSTTTMTSPPSTTTATSAPSTTTTSSLPSTTTTTSPPSTTTATSPPSTTTTTSPPSTTTTTSPPSTTTTTSPPSTTTTMSPPSTTTATSLPPTTTQNHKIVTFFPDVTMVNSSSTSSTSKEESDNIVDTGVRVDPVANLVNNNVKTSSSNDDTTEVDSGTILVKEESKVESEYNETDEISITASTDEVYEETTLSTTSYDQLFRDSLDDIHEMIYHDNGNLKQNSGLFDPDLYDEIIRDTIDEVKQVTSANISPLLEGVKEDDKVTIEAASDLLEASTTELSDFEATTLIENVLHVTTLTPPKMNDDNVNEESVNNGPNNETVIESATADTNNNTSTDNISNNLHQQTDEKNTSSDDSKLRSDIDEKSQLDSIDAVEAIMNSFNQNSVQSRNNPAIPSTDELADISTSNEKTNENEGTQNDNASDVAITEINTNSSPNTASERQSSAENLQEPTTENYINMTTINPEEGEDDFKGYDYYESLYDSLMTQEQTDEKINIDDLVSNAEHNRQTDMETTTLQSDTIEITTLVDNDDTKASIPISNVSYGNLEKPIEDIEQERVPPPSTDTLTDVINTESVGQIIKILSSGLINSDKAHDSAAESITEPEYPVIDAFQRENEGADLDGKTSELPIFEETTTVESHTSDDEMDSFQSYVTENDVDIISTTVATESTEVQSEQKINETVVHKVTSDVEHENLAQILVEDLPPPDYIDIQQPALSAIDYEATKDSIPEDSISDPDDISQSRLPSLDSSMFEEDSPQNSAAEIIAVNVDKIETPLSLRPSYKLTVSNEILLSDPSMNKKPQNAQAEVVHELNNQGVTNDILNSITSIIQGTMNEPPVNVAVSTSDVAGPEKIHNEQPKIQLQSNSYYHDENKEGENTDSHHEINKENLVHIPLEIIKVDSPSANTDKISISIPESVLKTEDTLQNYLGSQFPSLSHVVIKEHSSKVSVSNSNEKEAASHNDTEKSETASEDDLETTTIEDDAIDTTTSPLINAFRSDETTNGVFDENEATEVPENAAVTSEKEEDNVTTEVIINFKNSDEDAVDSVDTLMDQTDENSTTINRESENETDNSVTNNNEIRNTVSTIGSAVMNIFQQMLQNNLMTPQRTENSPNVTTASEDVMDGNVTHVLSDEQYPQYEDEHKHTHTEYSHDEVEMRELQAYDRPPARKDDSGVFPGADPPFFIKLPGSPNAVPLYIKYEPVKVKYVPVESRDGSIPLNEIQDSESAMVNPNEFASRTGIEDDVNAIEADITINGSMETKDIKNGSVASLPSFELKPPPESYDHIHDSDNPNSSDDINQSSQSKTPAISEDHAHIDLPLDFILPNPPKNQNLDPFTVIGAPDLASHEVNSIPGEDIYYHRNHPVYDDYEYGDEGEDFKVSVPDTLPKNNYGNEQGVVYGGVDLESLDNPVFKLKAKPHSTPVEEISNPAFTPFPITANPTKQKSSVSPFTTEPNNLDVTNGINTVTTETISSSTSTTESSKNQSSSAENVSNNSLEKRTGIPSVAYREPSSVDFPPMKTADFRISYNPEDVPTFMKENQNVFPAWYPQTSEENVIRAAALTAANPNISDKLTESRVTSEDYRKFKQGKPAEGTARHTQHKPLHDQNTLNSEDGQEKYGAFYHPADIPGIQLSDLTQRHLSRLQQSSEQPPTGPWYKTNSTNTDFDAGFLSDNPSAGLLLGPQFFQYLNNLPEPLLRDFLEPSLSERAVRVKRSQPEEGEQIYCEWNIKTEPGLYLLITFQNLSAPYSVDCHGAYIEVERENNGYDARWCGNRGAFTGTRPHVIFAKSEVRITVYDDGKGKKQSTGFEADIDVIDLFNPMEYNEFMDSNAYPHITRLLRG